MPFGHIQLILRLLGFQGLCWGQGCWARRVRYLSKGLTHLAPKRGPLGTHLPSVVSYGGH